jgi:hypothetical protein
VANAASISSLLDPLVTPLLLPATRRCHHARTPPAPALHRSRMAFSRAWRTGTSGSRVAWALRCLFSRACRVGRAVLGWPATVARQGITTGTMTW